MPTPELSGTDHSYSVEVWTYPPEEDPIRCHHQPERAHFYI